MPPRRPTLIRR